jgi:threonine/homoserine/homoserine lactone efflux protein
MAASILEIQAKLARMRSASLLAGIVLGLPAGLSPGPMLTLVISQTLKHGLREGLKVAVAPLFSDVPVVVLSLWLAATMSRANIAVAVISLAGAVFLVFLASECLRTRGLETSSQPAARSLSKAVGVNLLNPHPYLFWFTVGAPLLVRTWHEGASSAAGFLAAFYVCLVGSKLLIAVLVGRGRRLLTDRTYVWIMRALGVALLAFAALFVREGYRGLAY